MKQIMRNYQLSDEMVETILDRLGRFHDDDDAQAVGNEIAKQQNFNPNHEDDDWQKVKLNAVSSIIDHRAPRFKERDK